MGGGQETRSRFSQKNRRSRKPKFQLRITKHVCEKRKKDKKKMQMLEEFQFMFSEISERNRQLKELIAEVDAYILDKLAIWEAEDKLRLLTI